ncbi:MAG: hypothetical protein QS721_00745 [Candidatus Endonucleobacter sp. (ex Gigantidas childressi)]|nr:hypothetical protein [Candidatus Endonucleobacter sp. (ex Gigantidas childressi)]
MAEIMTLTIAMIKNRKLFPSIVSLLIIVSSLLFSEFNYALSHVVKQNILAAVTTRDPILLKILTGILASSTHTITDTDLEFLDENMGTIRTLRNRSTPEIIKFLETIEGFYKKTQTIRKKSTLVKTKPQASEESHKEELMILHNELNEKIATILATIRDIQVQSDSKFSNAVMLAKNALTNIVHEIKRQLNHDYNPNTKDKINIEQLNQLEKGIAYFTGNETPNYPARIRLPHDTSDTSAQEQAQAHAGAHHLFIASYDILGKVLLAPDCQTKKHSDEIEKWIRFYHNITTGNNKTIQTIPKRSNDGVSDSTQPFFKFANKHFFPPVLITPEQDANEESYLLNKNWKTLSVHNELHHYVYIRNGDGTIDRVDGSFIKQPEFQSTLELVNAIKTKKALHNKNFRVTTYMSRLNINSPSLHQTIQHPESGSYAKKDITKPMTVQAALTQQTDGQKYLTTPEVDREISLMLGAVFEKSGIMTVEDSSYIADILHNISRKTQKNTKQHNETRVSKLQTTKLWKGLSYLLGMQFPNEPSVNVISSKIKFGGALDESSTTLDLSDKQIQLSEISSNTISLAQTRTLDFLLEAYKILTDNTTQKGNIKHMDKILPWAHVFEQIISPEKQTIHMPCFDITMDASSLLMLTTLVSSQQEYDCPQIDKPEDLLIKFFNIKETSRIIPKRIIVDTDYVRNKNWKVIICRDRNRLIPDRTYIRYESKTITDTEAVSNFTKITQTNVTEYVVDHNADIIDVLSIRHDDEIYIYLPRITASIKYPK